MTYEENVRAILECNFAGSASEIIDVAVKRICELRLPPNKKLYKERVNEYIIEEVEKGKEIKDIAKELDLSEGHVRRAAVKLGKLRSKYKEKRALYIAEEAKNGRSYKDIAKELGLSAGTVQRIGYEAIGSRYKYPQPYRYKNKKEMVDHNDDNDYMIKRNAYIVEEAKKGRSYTDIAKELHISRQRVSQIAIEVLGYKYKRRK